MSIVNLKYEQQKGKGTPWGIHKGKGPQWAFFLSECCAFDLSGFLSNHSKHSDTKMIMSKCVTNKHDTSPNSGNKPEFLCKLFKH